MKNYLCIKMTKLCRVKTLQKKVRKMILFLNSCFSFYVVKKICFVYFCFPWRMHPTLSPFFIYFSFCFYQHLLPSSWKPKKEKKKKTRYNRRRNREREYYFQFSILRCRYHQQDLKSCKNIILYYKDRCETILNWN